MHKAFYKTPGLKTCLSLSPVFLLLFLPKLRVQQSTFPETKATEVDTLWGHDNSTPDSVAYNVFSRPNIVNTYGKEGNDPALDWEGMTPAELYLKAINN